MSFVGILLLAGCQNNNVEPPVVNEQNGSRVELIPVSTRFLDVQSLGGTRADYPQGYIPYSTLDPAPAAKYRKIGVIMTPYRSTVVGQFAYEEDINKWGSSVFVREDYPYYVHGFMPCEDENGAAVNVETSPLPGNPPYQAGAVLSVNGFTTLTPADVCVIVGARWASEAEGLAGYPVDDDVRLGEFSYVGKEQGKNRIFVLLKHIYAGIQFKMRIDPEYHKLRSIKIKKVELMAHDIPEAVNLSITLTANSEGKDPTLDPSDPTRSNIVYQNTGSLTDKTITIYEKPDDSDGIDVPETSTQGFLGCYRPGQYGFTLRTTYDVYDKNQKKDDGGNPVFDTEGNPVCNLVREDCVADNYLKTSDIPELDAGELFTVNLLVKPTYLYQMSEPDLDNPTIKLTTTP